MAKRKELPAPCCFCDHGDEKKLVCAPELGKVGDTGCNYYSVRTDVVNQRKGAPPVVDVSPKKTRSRTK
jgi:hypothetical protein